MSTVLDPLTAALAVKLHPTDYCPPPFEGGEQCRRCLREAGELAAVAREHCGTPTTTPPERPLCVGDLVDARLESKWLRGLIVSRNEYGLFRVALVGHDALLAYGDPAILENADLHLRHADSSPMPQYDTAYGCKTCGASSGEACIDLDTSLDMHTRSHPDRQKVADAPKPTPEVGDALRSPKGGKAHRQLGDWSSTVCCAQSIAGYELHAKLTVVVPIADVPLSDRCKKCWPTGGAS